MDGIKLFLEVPTEGTIIFLVTLLVDGLSKEDIGPDVYASEKASISELSNICVSPSPFQKFQTTISPYPKLHES